jgi:dihydropteroate synthase
MRGTPQTMQNLVQYENNKVVPEVFSFLQKRLAQLHLLGVKDVIVDPGFGFAKTLEQNYELLKKLSYFKELNVLAGMSRKSMIYNLLKIQSEDALTGTIAINMLALLGGASILRVHDVKEAVQVIQIFNQYCKY